MGLTSKIVIEIDGKEVQDFVHLKVIQSIYAPHEFEVECRLDTFEDISAFFLDTSKGFLGKPFKLHVDAYTADFKSSTTAFFFKGIVTSVKAVRTGDAADRVIISGYSPDILLCDNPGNSSYIDKRLSDIANTVLSVYPRDLLRYSVNPSYTDQLAYVVQYNETRYDFLRRLASRYGEWMFYDGTELKFGSTPESSGTLTLGLDLEDFGCSLQVNPLSFDFSSYDPKNDSVVRSASNDTTGQNQLNQAAIEAHSASMKLFRSSRTWFNHINNQQAGVAKVNSNAMDLRGARQALGMARASGSSDTASLKPGGKVMIKALKPGGAGEIDYGEYVITAVTHYCDNLKHYSNSFEAIPSKAKVPDHVDPLAFPVCQTQVAKVVNNKDPEKAGRVKVKFMWQTGGEETPWIRIAFPGAGKGSGFYFVPEIEEEVMVGFEGNDAEQPFVMGGIYNGKFKPEAGWYTDTNDTKIIRTRAGNTIELVDKNNGEEISIYQEKDKSSAHHITMVSKPTAQMTIFSKDKLVIEAKSIEIKTSQGNLDITSAKNLSMTSTSDMKMDGMNVNVKAKAKAEVEGTAGATLKSSAEASVEGSASAKVQGGANVTVKGGVVMIN